MNNLQHKSYIAYTGSHTDLNNCKGITIFDVDIENGDLKKRGEVEVSNASYLTTSPDKKYLYSITDKGVASFRILPDGNLKRLNTAAIRGMRGCHISTTKDNTFMFVSGYHDGKITVLRINEDGSVGAITDGIFHKGLGSVAERTYRPRIRCAQLTPDEKFLCVVDGGIDQVKFYQLNRTDGTLKYVDTMRCKQQTGPRRIMFSSDGRFAYMIRELSNTISVYSYDGSGKVPIFEKLQFISTLRDKCTSYSAAVALHFSPDERHIVCTNAGDNSVGLFRRDPGTGLLTKLRVLPISGQYPTDVCLFPDDRHLFCTNYDSSTMTFFKVDYEKGLLIMTRSPMALDQPKCALMVELPDDQPEE